MTLNDLDRSSGPTLVEISTSEGNLVELDGLQGKGKAVGRGLGQRVESCDYWSSGPCSEHNTWCMLRWGSSKGWPASPATLERMARTTSCAVKDKRHKTHKKEWFSARAQIFMDQIALNSIHPRGLEHWKLQCFSQKAGAWKAKVCQSLFDGLFNFSRFTQNP